MSVFSQYASTVYEQCDILARISETPGMVNRQYLTPQHAQANAQVAQWMKKAGMQTWQDEAGNQWGKLLSSEPDAKTLVIGSHLDTVPNGGKYDGILGVLLPVALCQYFTDHQRPLPFHLAVVGFGDEEGSRFGSTLLGSCAVAGTWQQKWGNLPDKHGVTLAQAMRDFGLDINRVQSAALASEDLMGFMEVHIEQGPVLEAEDIPVGLVSAIAGARRFSVDVKGLAGHAGTVPMQMRKDALCGSSEMILAVEKIASQHGVVATVGSQQVKPNAVNVICGHVTFSLDVRDQDNTTRDAAINDMLTQFEVIAGKRSLEVSVKQTHDADAVICDPQLKQRLEKSLVLSGMPVHELPSGAGHDAMAIAPLCPIAMLFVRCEKGISHHPAEAVDPNDIESALAVMHQFCELSAQQNQEEWVLAG